MSLPEMSPITIVPLFDEFLSSHGVLFEAVIIGGAALNVMGVITRQTIDMDVLTPEVPNDVKRLSLEFRKHLAKENEIQLIENWLNNGPKSLLRDLPQGWKRQTKTIFKGKAITLHTLGRLDLLRSKLFAYCDRDDRDQEDLMALKPTEKELAECMPWLEERDGNPMWPKHVKSKVDDLIKELGYGV